MRKMLNIADVALSVTVKVFDRLTNLWAILGVVMFVNIAGCGKVHSNSVQVKDTELAGYSESFFQDLKLHAPEVQYGALLIRFDDTLPSNKFGRTRSADEKDPGGIDTVVMINRKEFSKLDHSQKKYVLYHELGHGVLSRDHVSAEKCAVSIMCANMSADQHRAKQIDSAGTDGGEWSALVAELFSQQG